MNISCRSRRSQILFKIGVLKHLAIPFYRSPPVAASVFTTNFSKDFIYSRVANKRHPYYLLNQFFTTHWTLTGLPTFLYFPNPLSR